VLLGSIGSPQQELVLRLLPFVLLMYDLARRRFGWLALVRYLLLVLFAFVWRRKLVKSNKLPLLRAAR
jgi:hypothetical protein